MADTSNTALLDIANNGAALNQALSELTTNVAKLSEITLPAVNGGTGLTAPGASGNVLTSNGTSWTSSAIPSFSGTWTVPNGGTGQISLTAYGVLCGGTTTTDAVQSLATGTSGQVLTSAGSSAVPVFQTLTQSQLATAFNASGSAPFYACRAWVNFDGTRDISGAVSAANTNRFIRASGNVTSVLRNGTGDYTITFTTALPDEDFSAVGTCGSGSSPNYASAGVSYCNGPQAAQTTTTYRFGTGWTTVGGSSGSRQDVSIISVLIFR